MDIKNYVMSIKKLVIISILIPIFFLYFTNIALADITAGGLEESGDNAGFSTESNGLVKIIGSIVKVFLSFLGVIFLILVIIGADMWMTSGGNPEQLAKAKKYITNAIIGFIIVSLAYVLASFAMTGLM